ncbi:ECF transporter S component [Convivina intestini]|uniref:Putative membrane protein n=1 Tax=Convivina intestini TaxID=1505726 RepID=A0A2U1DFH8_9LACO|nr:ECF transporter S component [Convivina intestini]PVY86329.1 putative membrane protein [Convivina intestini]CAH1850823.1 Pantothenic acid transporter PanT [Convivina intestini]SDB82560.1 Uncharacterized membrane protein [Leuconostocaceae bacterium R-53105]
MQKSKNIQSMVVTAIFAAIIILLSFTPLGLVPVGPINATTIHIPVIIGGILLGPKRGAFLGLVFGLASLIHSTVAPTILGFIFSPFVPVIGTNHGSWLAVIIAIVPRVIIGVVPAYIFKGLGRIFGQQKQTLSLVLTGFIASFMDTIMVMGLIELLFRHQYAQALGQTLQHIDQFILGIVFTNGLAEGVLAAVVTAAVTGLLMKIVQQSNR